MYFRVTLYLISLCRGGGLSYLPPSPSPGGHRVQCLLVSERGETPLVNLAEGPSHYCITIDPLCPSVTWQFTTYTSVRLRIGHPAQLYNFFALSLSYSSWGLNR